MPQAVTFNHLYYYGRFLTNWYDKYGTVHSVLKGGHMYNFLNYDIYLFPKIVLIIANSVDTNEMQHYAAFHLGLHYLPNYPFRGFQYTKG